jgi:hypothetical protein
MDITINTNIHDQAKGFLMKILSTRISGPAQLWLDRMQKEFSVNSYQGRTINLAFSAASRYTSKTTLCLDKEELEEANCILPHWNISRWTEVQCVRALLVLLLDTKDKKEFVRILNKMFDTGEIEELVALYASLPLFPYSDSFIDRASEGVRNNITPVFDAIALGNPYPAAYLSDDAWNQLVLKAIFNNRPVYQIIGLDKRTNKALTKMLLDFAHERWAAGRTFTPQLWRCAGPYLEVLHVDDLKKALASSDHYEQKAAALACICSQKEELQMLIQDLSEQRWMNNEVGNWQSLTDEYELKINK